MLSNAKINEINDVTNEDLDISDLLELFKTYADFFTLPLLNPSRFKQEVLNDTDMNDIEPVLADFDRAMRYIASVKYAETHNDLVPAREHWEVNYVANLKIRYKESIMGPHYFDEKVKGGLAKNDTALLKLFFTQNRFLWAFINLQMSDLEKAAKKWYKKHAQNIVTKNADYTKDFDDKFNDILKKSKLEFTSKDDLINFKESIKVSLAKLDATMSRRAYKKSVKKYVKNQLKLYQLYHPDKLTKRIKNKQTLFARSADKPKITDSVSVADKHSNKRKSGDSVDFRTCKKN